MYAHCAKIRKAFLSLMHHKPEPLRSKQPMCGKQSMSFFRTQKTHNSRHVCSDTRDLSLSLAHTLSLTNRYLHSSAHCSLTVTLCCLLTPLHLLVHCSLSDPVLSANPSTFISTLLIDSDSDPMLSANPSALINYWYTAH